MRSSFRYFNSSSEVICLKPICFDTAKTTTSTAAISARKTDQPLWRSGVNLRPEPLNFRLL
jgi:hypothetical protein